MHGYWVDEASDTIVAHVGSDIWQTTRADRYSGLRAWNSTNGDTPVTINCVQTIVIGLPDDTHHCLEMFEATPEIVEEYQAMAHFLRSSLRLSPRNVTFVLHFLSYISKVKRKRLKSK